MLVSGNFIVFSLSSTLEHPQSGRWGQWDRSDLAGDQCADGRAH